MRRPRHKLQVSTFPFLAVLLCAMGALILFLLVMDRRGKLVAAAKARAAQEARVADRSQEDAARKAEWEKQRDALHQTLLVQREQLHGEAAEADKLLAGARQKLQAKQAEYDDLKRDAAGEGVKLTQFQTQLKQGSTGLADSAKLEATAKAELVRLSGEVADLEKVLLDLKSLKKHEQHTYSLVPYRGKQGDNRRPIYVECVRGGVALHPGRRVLAGPDFNALALRAEVERRAGGLEREAKKGKQLQDPAPSRGPYVLFLIRPDGIPSYYEAMAWLKGFEIDFGYEVVDQHWVLDFGTPGDLAGPAPWGGSSVPPPTSTFPPVASGPKPLEGGSTGTAGSGPAGPPSLKGPPSIAATVPGSGLPGGAAIGPKLGGSGVTSIGAPGDYAPGALAPPAYGQPGSVGGNTPGLPGSSAAREFPAGKLPPAEPLVKAGPGLPFGGVAVGPDQGGPSGAGKSQPPPQAKPNGSPEQNTGLPSPWRVPGSGVAPGSPGASGPGVPGSEASSQGGAKGSGLSPLQGSSAGKPQSPPPALGSVVGSRDFVITITCYSDHVTVLPGGKQFSWKDGNGAATDQAVVQNVQDLIAGRQKAVRPGEPPYRPMIRFQLAPGGLIRFLHVYPRLEFLQVPMTRENLDD